MSPAVCKRCGWRGRGCTAERCAELTSGPGEVWTAEDGRQCYPCGHVKVTERPTCPVSWCGVERGPREVGGAVVLCSSERPAYASWAVAAEANDRRVIGRAEYPCGHGLRDGSPECPTCERLQVEADAAEDAALSAARRVSDEARAELQALAEALNQRAPIVDAVPFTLRGEARKDDGARPVRLF